MKIFYMLGLIGIITFESNAQINLSTFRISVGAMEINSFNYTDKRAFSIYPEIDIGGQLIHQKLIWSLYWGYWKQIKADYPRYISDGLFYQSSGHVTGTRIYYDLLSEKFKPFKAFISGGLNCHMTFFNNTNGGLSGTIHDQDHRRNYFYAEYGLLMTRTVLPVFSVHAGITHSALIKGDDHANQDRLLLKAGIVYSIK
jgi:hypothetical protein